MRIKESKLRRIIRRTIIETFSDSQSTSRTGNLGKLPVETDPSRNTFGVGSVNIDNLIAVIDNIGVEEDMSLEEIRELRGVANKLNDCMTYGDGYTTCATKIMDSGMENAFAELGYIVHDSLDQGPLSDYILEVERIMMNMIQ